MSDRYEYIQSVVRNKTVCNWERKDGGGTRSYNECGWRDKAAGDGFTA